MQAEKCGIAGLFCMARKEVWGGETVTRPAEGPRWVYRRTARKPLIRMIRPPAYESGGQEFESLRVRHLSHHR